MRLKFFGVWREINALMQFRGSESRQTPRSRERIGTTYVWRQGGPRQSLNEI